MTTILVTGFGPFPGAPFNPTGPLVAQLARLRRPRLAGVTVVGHVFATSYAAVDHELPLMIARHKPDALLMFGLATRARTLRIETRARNTLALLPDAGGGTLRRTAIAAGGGAALALPVCPHGACCRPRGPRACRWRCRAMPANTSAITSSGAPPRPPASPAGPGSPPLCMSRTSPARRGGGAKSGV